MRDHPLLALALAFLPLSLLSVGGGPSILAGMESAVLDHHWMSEQEFLDLFAISRAAPGPGSLLAALIGWKVAGLAGAVVAAAAIFLPSSLLYYWVARRWNTHRGKPWHSAVERGLAPVAAGLILAGSLVILRASGTEPVLLAIAALSTAALLWWRTISPLWVLTAGGAVAVLFG